MFQKLGYLKVRYSKLGLTKNFVKKFSEKKFRKKNFQKKFLKFKVKVKVKGQLETGSSTGSLCLFYCDVIMVPRLVAYTTNNLPSLVALGMKIVRVGLYITLRRMSFSKTTTIKGCSVELKYDVININCSVCKTLFVLINFERLFKYEILTIGDGKYSFKVFL